MTDLPTPTSTGALHASGIRIRRQLHLLSWSVPVAVVVLIMVLAAAFFQFRAKPLALDKARTAQNEATERVGNKMNNLADQIDRLVLTMRDWSDAGVIGLDNPAAFNHVLMPALTQNNLVSSVHLASDEGREVLLLKSPEGWKNRITHVPLKGKQQHWLYWRDANSASTNEWKEQDYDPRKRPWFQGVMGAPENQVYWTEPYMFQTTQEPGITAAVRWKDGASGHQRVVAFDVLLSDLTRLTLELPYAVNGQVALLSPDGRVLGLPRKAGFTSEESVKKAVLKDPAAIGLGVLAAALKAGRNAQESPLGLPIASDAGLWRVKLQDQSLRNQRFRLALMAPEEDFAPWTPQFMWALALFLLTIALTGAVVGARLYRTVAAPISDAFAQIALSNQALASQGVRAAELAELVTALQKAETFHDLGQALLTGLAQRMTVGQASLYLADTKQQQLVLCSGFARHENNPLAAKIAYGDGLVGQCALELRPIRLNHPTSGYLRVSSALGTADPSTLLIQPVINNDTLLGIIELALIDEFTPNDQALIDNMLPTLALCMEIMVRNQHTQDLLDQAQSQTDELTYQQQQNADSEKRLRELLELSPMGCSIATAEGVSVFRNRRLAEMLGYTLEQLKTVNATDYWVHPEDRLQFVEQLKRDGKVLDFRSYCKRPDGSRFTALLNASMEDVFGGRHIVSWSYDITRLIEAATQSASVDAKPNQEASI